MDISIHARHGRLPDSLRNQAEQRLARMERFDPRLTAASLVTDTGAKGHRAEVRVAPVGAPPLIAHSEASTLRSAIDGALSRVEQQLKRRSERRVARRTRSGAVVRDQVIP